MTKSTANQANFRNFSRKKVKGGKLTERFLGPYKIINVLPHGVYELRNEGKTTRATGSHLKMYKSSDGDAKSEGKVAKDTDIYYNSMFLYINITMLNIM